MTTPYKDGYGLGVNLNLVNGRQWIEHGGSASGVSARLAHAPESETTVVVLGNTSTPSAAAIGRLLGEVAQGETVTLSSELGAVEVAPEVLERYVGSYRLRGATARFESDGRQLFLVNQGRRAPLQASSDTAFFLTTGASQAITMRFTFVLDDADNVIEVLAVNGNGQNFRLTPLARVAPADISLSSDVLSRYVGRYELAEDFYMTITLEDGRLMAQATGQSKSALSAITETEFVTDRDDIQFEFEIQDSTAVALIVHRSGSSDIRAPKQ
jgi:hypothetical protein